jgi:hypothetical protein
VLRGGDGRVVMVALARIMAAYQAESRSGPLTASRTHRSARPTRATEAPGDHPRAATASVSPAFEGTRQVGRRIDILGTSGDASRTGARRGG